MKRILCILGSMDVGGAETFLMKVYRNIDRSKTQFDFCVAKKEKNFYEDEILSMGGKIYRVTPKSNGIIKNFKDIKKLVKTEKYEYILRISQHSLSSLELFAAKLGGAKKVAFRSSNSNNCGSKLNLLIHYLFRPFLNLICDIKIAPSKEAAIYMFGKQNTKKGKVIFIHNALDYEKYRFNENNRKKIRNELNILDNNIVIGHVGRFNYQKNHKFLLDIFKSILQENNDYKLLLLGDGELKDDMIEYSKKINIYKNVIFAGVKQNVNEYYSAMDLYVFPSLFEGMPNTVIEAQAAGLNCIISDTITKEANISGDLTYLSLNDNIEKWKKTILRTPREHNNTKDKFIEKKYNIKDISKDFVELF